MNFFKNLVFDSLENCISKDPLGIIWEYSQEIRILYSIPIPHVFCDPCQLFMSCSEQTLIMKDEDMCNTYVFKKPKNIFQYSHKLPRARLFANVRMICDRNSHQWTLLNFFGRGWKAFDPLGYAIVNCRDMDSLVCESCRQKCLDMEKTSFFSTCEKKLPRVQMKDSLDRSYVIENGNLDILDKKGHKLFDKSLTTSFIYLHSYDLFFVTDTKHQCVHICCL